MVITSKVNMADYIWPGETGMFVRISKDNKTYTIAWNQEGSISFITFNKSYYDKIRIRDVSYSSPPTKVVQEILESYGLHLDGSKLTGYFAHRNNVTKEQTLDLTTFRHRPKHAVTLVFSDGREATYPSIIEAAESEGIPYDVLRYLSSKNPSPRSVYYTKYNIVKFTKTLV